MSDTVISNDGMNDMAASDIPRNRGRRSSDPVRVQGARLRTLETARNRLLIASLAFGLAFSLVAGRLVELATLSPDAGSRVARMAATNPTAGRGNIVDRNGIVLATSLPTASLYANPQEILDPVAAARSLVSVLPHFDAAEIRRRLSSPGRFVWIQRRLTPAEHHAIHRLGIPGLAFVEERRRVYPHGRVAAHVLGLTDIDSRGIAGIERTYEQHLAADQAVRLSLDIRVQHILRDELATAMDAFHAIGAAGVVIDVHTGEVVAMASLPDFDPHRPGAASDAGRFNRATKGVYEMGSTFKLFTAAMALDSGRTTLEGGYDATKPLRVARFTIRDYKPENRWLSVPEILMHSSNIGAAKMALDVGADTQRAYLARLGLMSPAAIELPEVGKPLTPARWREINTMTVAYGHGIAVSPVQLATAVAAVVNGGVYRAPTLRPAAASLEAPQVLKPSTSRQIRGLMRLVVRRGTGGQADVPGYRVGGKTGTAEKQVNGRYHRKALMSSFVGAFPMDQPRYVVLAMLDEPKGSARTHHYATGGWVAAPVVGAVIRRMAPLLGIQPIAEDMVPPMPTPRPRQQQQQETPLFVAIENAIADARGRRLAAN